MSAIRKRILKIEITLLVFAATLTSLTLAFSGADDRAAAPPYAQNAAKQSAVTPAYPIIDISEAPKITSSYPGDAGPGSAVTPDAKPVTPDKPLVTPPNKAAVDRYVTLTLDESEISVGDLILVNKDHYYEIPEKGGLVLIGAYKSRSYILLDGDARLAERVMEPLNAMMDDFMAETGLKNILINSSFRTLKQQQAALDTWVARIGAEGAKRMASQPGYSEHHTGLALDLALYSDGVISTFKGTGKYAWIHNNAYKYGFVLRYKESKQDITGTNYEPWHFRYIGVPHAYFMEKKDYAFEEYMEYLMSFDFEGAHMYEIYDGVLYEIYSVTGTQVPVPKECEYTISGNNTDGFIVTVKHGADARSDVTVRTENAKAAAE